jgi:hypothetical protein
MCLDIGILRLEIDIKDMENVEYISQFRAINKSCRKFDSFFE